MVQSEAVALYLGALVEVVDALSLEEGDAPSEAVDDAVFVEQERGGLGAIQASDARDECGFVM